MLNNIALAAVKIGGALGSVANPNVYADELAQLTIIFFYIFVGLIGLAVGSFLNVVIYRVPEKMSLIMPPSHCPKCNYKLKWYDNIPIISYIILGGKCRNCGEHISFRYTVVEFLNMLLWLLCVFVFLDAKCGGIGQSFNYDNSAFAIIAMLACSVLVCVAFIDLEHTIIPDRLQVALALLGIAAIVCNFCGWNDGLSWLDRVIGMVGSAIVFLAIYFGAKLVYKREGMGFGDVKLVTGAGLLLGWQNMILTVIIAAVVASIVLVAVRRVRNDEKNHEYPFGPFLVFGMLVSLFAGNAIISGYLSLFI